jgi:hypothetical protein
MIPVIDDFSGLSAVDVVVAGDMQTFQSEDTAVQSFKYNPPDGRAIGERQGDWYEQYHFEPIIVSPPSNGSQVIGLADLMRHPSLSADPDDSYGVDLEKNVQPTQDF